jgi:hypothetical protein
MPVYSAELRLYATVCIRAKNRREAREKAAALKGDPLELNEQDGELPICGKCFSDPGLPDVSLSPVMTVFGLDRGARFEEIE